MDHEIMQDKEFVDGMFQQLVAVINDPEMQKMVTFEQKKAILASMGTSVTEPNDRTVEVTFLFAKLTVDLVTGAANLSFNVPVKV